jgi:D-lactate dehydrogenase (cytochrome)
MTISTDTQARFRTVVGDRLSTADAVRDQHSRDEFWHAKAAPEAVAFPDSTEEVAALVKICRETGTPVIAYGAGTSIEGHIQAIHGGLCIDLGRMNQVLAVNAADFDCIVQPGVTRKQLNEYIRDTGLFFPIDPGADASIGGMAGTRASGTNAVRYGTMRDSIMAAKVVLPDGRIIDTARRARKSSAGLDLTRLFVGSEGILGIMTELTVRLHAIPESIAAAVVPFPGVEEAVNSVVEMIQSGVPIARVELMDEVQMKATNDYSGFDYPAQPTLFMEFHGTTAGTAEQVEITRGIVAGHGAGEFQWATDTGERNRLWQARHDAAYAVKAMRPGAEMWGTDVCVPISRLTECILDTRKDLENCPFPAPMLGHVGDGNYHLIFLIDVNDPEEVRLAEELNARMIARALAVDGTCTGEHGIGIGKKQFLEDELGEAVDVMRAIKLALDPTNIMNPGKMIDVHRLDNNA